MDFAPIVVELAYGIDSPTLTWALLRALSVGSAFLAVFDDKNYLRYANDACRDAFCVELGQSVTLPELVEQGRCGATLHKRSLDSRVWGGRAPSDHRNLIPSESREAFLEYFNERCFSCTETVMPNGWLVIYGIDITAQKNTEQMIRAERDHALRLSGVDELTQIPNRRATLAELDSALLSREGAPSPGCIALIDLDYFKVVNDTFGHETGDAALRHFAQHCTAKLPRESLLGRLGGEEFLMILSEATVIDAKKLLDELIGAFPPLSSKTPDTDPVQLSFSAGVANLCSGESRDSLLSRADTALYGAKRSGRSRVMVDEKGSSVRQKQS
jgi:diguanylate cyclase (GGDEF)-like protein